MSIVLSKVQQEIVDSTEKNIVVSAGAGSGKTRVLTERIKHLLVKGVKPSNIVAITFTNMAADEMKERLKEVYSGDMFIGTIHSFASRILRSSGDTVKILGFDDRNSLMKVLINRYATNTCFDDYLKVIDFNDKVEQGKIPENASITDYFDITFASVAELKQLEKGNIDEHYKENLYTLAKKLGYITFNELLLKSKDYFKSLGDDAFLDYLFVDELQDVGTLEYDFIKSLNAVHNFFVGDDWQAIYGFKGGNVSIFKSLLTNPDFKVYELTDNYRNPESVIDLSKEIISQVSSKSNRDVVCHRDSSNRVILESKASIDKYLQKIPENEYSKWAVLVRTNRDLFLLQEKCNKLGIPCLTFKKSDVTLEEMQDNLNKNAVKILTVHTSKGLEFDSVIVYGNFPIYVPSYLKNDDERKVMYVAVTRAEDRLIILN